MYLREACPRRPWLDMVKGNVSGSPRFTFLRQEGPMDRYVQELTADSCNKSILSAEAGLRRDRLREDDDFPQAVKPSMYEHDTVLKFLARADEPGVAINMMDIPLYAVARPWFIE